MDIDYISPLDYGERMRIHILTERGKLQKALCQYETFLDDVWTPIVRYDTAHGFFHRDTLYPDGTKEKKMLNYVDLDSAVKYAKNDLILNWKSYKYRYLTQKGGR